MIHPECPELNDLVRGIRSTLALHSREDDIVRLVVSQLGEALDRGLVLDPRFTAPVAERYVMYPLYVAEDRSFSIASAVWGVGQATPIHDHGVWGVVGIWSGIEHEVRFERTPNGLSAVGEADFLPGDSVICCTREYDLHQVSCGSGEPCVGIHVYGGDIGTHQRHKFDLETGTAEPFVSRWPWLLPPIASTS